jgi:predicted phage tail component-like protein
MSPPVDLTYNAVALSSAVPAANVVQVSRQLVGRRRHERVQVPGRAGSWFFPEEPGDRDLVAELVIVADGLDDRRASVRALADWADLPSPARLVLSDEPDRFHEAILDRSADPAEWLTAAKISLPFSVGPYAIALATSEQVLSISGFPAGGTFEIPDEVNALPVVEITPTNGTLTSFTFAVNGYAISWAGNLTSGNTITVSSLSDTVTTGPNGDVNLTGAFDRTALTMADVSGEFPLLLPGANPWTMTRTGTATTATVRLLWRERFR